MAEAAVLATVDDRKRAAALAAVGEVAAGMIVGLGTGSTAAHLIPPIAARVAAGEDIRAVATSLATAEAARAAGIPLLDFAEVDAIDLCIDGVDEIDADLRAIKGAGGAMLREKIVATAARRMIAIADDGKQVAQLGGHPVPVEVLPFAQAFVARRITELGGTPTLRLRDGQPYRTDQGNAVLDCAFGPIGESIALATALSACPGILGHGLFPVEIDTIYLGTPAGVLRRDKKV